MRFLFPTALTIWVHLARVYLTRYVPLTGFLNLLAVSSSDCPMVLFHTMRTHGIRPTEYSPQTQHRTFVRFGHLLHPHHPCRLPQGQLTWTVQSHTPESIWDKTDTNTTSSTSKSVHSQYRCYPILAADTLLSLLPLILRSV